MDSFGKNPKGQQLARIQKSDNFKDGKFYNLIPTQATSSIKESLSTTYNWLTKSKTDKPPKNIPVNIASSQIENSEKFNFTWLGHSSLYLNIQNQSILFDPVFSKRASPFQSFGLGKRLHKSPVTVENFEKLDFILISHDHFDHLDMATIKALKDKTDLFIVPLGLGSHLEYWGVSSSKIVELDWYENFSKNGLTFTCFPARHSSGRTSANVDKTLWSSWGISSIVHKIFLSGDTGYFEEFKKIGEKYGPFDLAFMQIGTYVDELPDIHMTPEEAGKSCTDLKIKKVVPIHWATFDLAMHGWSEPIRRFLPELGKRNIEYLVPKIGENISFFSNYKQTEWWKED